MYYPGKLQTGKTSFKILYSRKTKNLGLGQVSLHLITLTHYNGVTTTFQCHGL